MASPDRYRGTLSKLVDRSTVQASRALDLMTRQADTQDPIGISVRDGEHRHLVRAEEVTDAGTLAEVTGAYATKYAGSPFVRPLLGEPAVNATLRLDPA
jgi:hypothetical protein